MNPEPRRTAAEQTSPLPVDTGMFDCPRSTACYLISAQKPALIDSGAANTAGTLITALEEAGITELDSIVLTHIHLDHAGGAGELVRRFPEAIVYIHERVARHLVDPSRLTAGARSVWGDRTDELFGILRPIPEDRIVPIADRDRISLGDRELTAIATPGHTRAHLAFLDESNGAVICGDALGVHLGGVARPATPPADFSLEDSLRTMAAIRDLGATSLHVAHYGAMPGDAAETCDRAAHALRRWHEAFERERARATDRDDLARRAAPALEGFESAAPEVRRQLDLVNPAWLNLDGMAIEADRHGRS